LVLCNAFAHYVRDADYPWGLPADSLERFMAEVKAGWGTEANVDVLAPSRVADARFRKWWARNGRLGIGPGQRADIIRAGFEADARPFLASVRVPTLVLHRQGNRYIKIGAGPYIADHIDGAKFVALSGDDHLFYSGDIVDSTLQLAGPTQVLVSETVKGLLVGTGIALSDRGSHVLKGVPDEWRIFAVGN
jgi:pimeloyl-ACP methyl ester carboxylesterase